MRNFKVSLGVTGLLLLLTAAAGFFVFSSNSSLAVAQTQLNKTQSALSDFQSELTQAQDALQESTDMLGVLELFSGSSAAECRLNPNKVVTQQVYVGPYEGRTITNTNCAFAKYYKAYLEIRRSTLEGEISTSQNDVDRLTLYVESNKSDLAKFEDEVGLYDAQAALFTQCLIALGFLSVVSGIWFTWITVRRKRLPLGD